MKALIAKLRNPTLWLIVGGVAAVLVLLPTFRACQIAERSLEQSMKNPKEAPLTEQEPKNVSIPLALSPREIIDDIGSRPSLQQRDVIKSYIGNRVDWLLEFAGAKEKQDGQVRVFLRTPRAGFPDFPVIVVGEVKLSTYPWLNITHDGSVVRVQGKIRDIDELGIKLDDVQLELKLQRSP